MPPRSETSGHDFEEHISANEAHYRQYPSSYPAGPKKIDSLEIEGVGGRFSSELAGIDGTYDDSIEVSEDNIAPTCPGAQPRPLLVALTAAQALEAGYITAPLTPDYPPEMSENLVWPPHRPAELWFNRLPLIPTQGRNEDGTRHVHDFGKDHQSRQAFC